MTERTSLHNIGMTWRTLAPASQAIRRYVVLLPNADLHEVALARALWTLAGENMTPIQVIALIDDWADEGAARMRMALFSALLRESGLNAGVAFEQADVDWVRIARKAIRPGDAIVCMAEQRYPVRIDNAGVKLAPLSHHLAMLHLPICEINGILIAPPSPTFKRTFKTLLLPALIIMISLALEVVFVNLTHSWSNWVQHAAIGAYTLVELISIARLTQE